MAAQPSSVAADTSFIRSLPKAELHIHIEGSLEPEQMFELAQRNSVKLPYATVEDVRAAYKFSNLQSFLDIYYAGAAVLQTERDFFDLTWAYIERALADNVRHSEIFFDPQTHTDRGIALSVVFAGIAGALRKAREERGFSSGLILCFLRHLSEESAIATLNDALKLRESYSDVWLGVGLDSGEKGNPPEKFARVFALAKEAGLRLVAHAGEEGPAAYVSTALDVLHVERVDHGVHCEDDAELVRRLAEQRTALTVCPLSNLKLCVFHDLSQHNFARLLRAGVAVTINSDDPAYFGGYMNANYEAIAAAVSLTPQELAQCAKNSFQASFVAQEQRDAWCAEVDRCLAALGSG